MAKDYKLFFVADAHFGCGSEDEENEKREKFEAFLKTRIRKNDYLFIIGDLFDFWFEYRYLIPKDCFRVLALLSNLVRRGVKVIFIGGNHDYWENKFLETEVGIKFCRESMTVELLSKKFFLHHGDGIDKSDRGYLLLRKILRSRISIWLYKLIHPDFGSYLAKSFSNTSRLNSNTRKKPSFDHYYKYAEKKFGEGIDFVIMGHTHIPLMKQFGDKYFINVGDWIDHFTYGVYDGVEFKLEKWV
ncbi:UDP-2,3-diacylglucosamine diphosphatase [bacterium]|nr:UDP-2,3-diacylglucosamine diphosphatase [bacterium]